MHSEMEFTMRTVPAVLLLSCAPLFLSGCSFVYCEKPFGTPLDKSELKQFEGEWLFDDVVSVKLGKDHLIGAVLKFDNARDKFVAESFPLYLTRHGGAQFLFMEESARKKDCWMMLATEATPNKVTCRLADVKKFNSLLDEGHVKGKRLSQSQYSKNPPSILLDLNNESFTALLKHASIDELFPPENTFTIEKRIPPAKK